MADVLIIDDQDRYTELCRRTMPEHDYHGPARSWSEAKDLLKGNGRRIDVVLLDVHFDIAPSAVERARDHASTQTHTCSFHHGDFLEESPETPFDWVFEHTFYCAIQPDRRNDYLQAMLRWIKPGGSLLAVNYLIPDEDGPPFGTTRDEVFQRFSPHFELKKDWVPRSYPNRTGLERMFWWRKPL